MCNVTVVRNVVVAIVAIVAIVYIVVATVVVVVVIKVVLPDMHSHERARGRLVRSLRRREANRCTGGGAGPRRRAW
jgi:hypothetical protein